MISLESRALESLKSVEQYKVPSKESEIERLSIDDTNVRNSQVLQDIQFYQRLLISLVD
jgi:hypothetical protein